jgi:hypothetical protein
MAINKETTELTEVNQVTQSPQRSSFYLTNIENVSSTISSIRLEYPSLSSLSSLLELEYLRSLVRGKGHVVLFPKKSCSHIRYHEIERYGFRFFIRPGFSPNGVRHRTRLNHACWFSKKPEIMFLTIREAMIKYPQYMIWIYRNLSINWSVYCIANFEFLINKHEGV